MKRIGIADTTFARFDMARAAIDGSADIGVIAARRLPEGVMQKGSDPRALWQAYLHLKSLDEKTVRELLEAASRSTSRPFRTSGPKTDSVH